MLTPNVAKQQVVAAIAKHTAASFTAAYGPAITPNALGRAVTGYTGHARMFSNLRAHLLRNAGYRAQGRWPALTYGQYCTLCGVAPKLGSNDAKVHTAAAATVGKVLGAAYKRPASAILPPIGALRSAANAGARQAKVQAATAPTAPVAAE